MTCVVRPATLALDYPDDIGQSRGSIVSEHIVTVARDGFAHYRGDWDGLTLGYFLQPLFQVRLDPEASRHEGPFQ